MVMEALELVLMGRTLALLLQSISDATKGENYATNVNESKMKVLLIWKINFIWPKSKKPH